MWKRGMMISSNWALSRRKKLYGPFESWLMSRRWPGEITREIVSFRFPLFSKSLHIFCQILWSYWIGSFRPVSIKVDCVIAWIQSYIFLAFNVSNIATDLKSSFKALFLCTTPCSLLKISLKYRKNHIEEIKICILEWIMD